ncbi:MAG: hypothetical protein WC604_04870 [Candidatus Gracilibacteria bacterium]
MDNEFQPQPPQPQPPVNAPQPMEETKTLEEISGTANPPPVAEMPSIEMPDVTPSNKAEIYSKLTRIFVPVVVAVVIIGAGTAIYKLFLTSSDTSEPTSESGTESETPGSSILPDTSEVLNEDFSDSFKKALEEAVEVTADETEPDETQPKIPQIKPKK